MPPRGVGLKALKHPVRVLIESLGLRPIDHESLGTWPSAVRQLTRLSDSVGGSIWLKDDGAAPHHGGNKARKLELLLAEAKARRATGILTVGAIGSNQVLGTAILARSLGLATRALVLPRGGAVSSADAQKMVQAAASGAVLIPTRLEDVSARLDELLDDDPDLYLVPSGASTPLGNLAFAAAAFELRAQIEAGALPVPDDIFVAMGTGGTAAGLAVGCGLAGLPCRIVGVRVADDGAADRAAVERQIAASFVRLRALGSNARELAAPLRIVDDQVGAGHGEPSAEGTRAIALLAELEGLPLEPTYTGKAMAALLDSCAREPGRTTLFWQTASSVTRPAVDPRDVDHEVLPPLLRDWLGVAGRP